MANDVTEVKLAASRLGQYVRLECCDRYLRFSLRKEEARGMRKKWGVTWQPLTPLLHDAGLAFETLVTDRFREAGDNVVDLRDDDIGATAQLLADSPDATVLLQAPVEARLGSCICTGRPDIIRLSRGKTGSLNITVTDVKASRIERTEHRIQVAAYVKAVTQLLEQQKITDAEISGSVITQGENGSLATVATNEPFELDIYLKILDQLVADKDSTTRRVLDAPFADVNYHLSYKCDGCEYNAVCMWDSAERMDIALTPYITAIEKRALQSAGVRSLPHLAELMDLPDKQSQNPKLIANAHHAELVDQLTNEWPVGANLPFLVQRAKRAVKRFRPDTEARTFLYGSGFGNLPSDELYPNLVKLFIDAQRDYLRDYVYMLSASVVGPGGTFTVVDCTDGPPTHDSEAALLVSWVVQVLTAIRAAASADTAPVHLYSYNRYDQRVLLDALKRHLEKIAEIPAFFDFLTQSPALSQQVITFLSDELRDRRIIGSACTPLHDSARMLGFDWKDGTNEYFSLFRARMFDNRRHVTRTQDGSLRHSKDTHDPGRFPIETASRFNSQIPLEYAYAIWDHLPADTKGDALLQPFRRISMEQLKGFAAHRMRALAHIEGSFKHKSRGMEKPPISLTKIGVNSQLETTLARSIVEFLHMEHHSSYQEKMQHYGQPIERRVQTGRSLLIRSMAHTKDDKRYEFKPEFELAGLEPALAINNSRLKEGDWVVLCEADGHQTPGRVRAGRLASIVEFSSDCVSLELMRATFSNQRFRYPHNVNLKPEPGRLYTIDEMADDMTADKALAALRHVENNTLYQWMVAPKGTRPLTRKDQLRYDTFADALDARLRRPVRLTRAQKKAVTGHFGEPLLLVQGPPGTGKTRTLAWAVLARMAASAIDGRPCRVLVSCKTHNAIKVLLRGITAAKRDLTGIAMRSIGADKLQDLDVFKIVNNAEAQVPEGITPLHVFGARDSLKALLERDLVVIGGTPGGFYNLMRYHPNGGRDIDWNFKPFDLAAFDEAAQLNLPESLLAAAFLHDKGNVIAVGDHRQMPPIVAHPWEQELKRTVMEQRPFLSLFEYLLERGFPCVGLDQSFRLHKTVAEFLYENIYKHDGIKFFSKNIQLLEQAPPTNPFVDSVLGSHHPIVVVEHDEKASHQFNELELDLLIPIVDVVANKLRLDGLDGIGVVVPHRAQKALLRKQFPRLSINDAIDTVERFQGDERDVVIVSATASDPDYVLAEAGFLLDLNRLNVAMSRSRRKLIVIASRSVVELLTSDLHVFENAAIWKRLYQQYAWEKLFSGSFSGITVRVRGAPPHNSEAAEQAS